MRMVVELNAQLYSLNKKEWICSLFKEWILEKSEKKSEFGVNICVIHSFSEWPQDHSESLSDHDPWGDSKMSEKHICSLKFNLISL